MTKTTLAVTIVLSFAAAAFAGVVGYYVCVATHGNDAFMVATDLAIYVPCIWYVTQRVRTDAKALGTPLTITKSDFATIPRMAAAILGTGAIAIATGWYVERLTESFALAFVTMTPILVAFWVVYVRVLVPRSPYFRRPTERSERSTLRISLGASIFCALVQPFAMYGNFSLRLHDDGIGNTVLILSEFALMFLMAMTATAFRQRLQRLNRESSTASLTAA